MYVEMGWAEKEFEQLVAGYAFFFGGIGQLLVAIFEMIQGSTFSFAVFGSYAFFWLGWALIYIESHRGEENTEFNMSSYPDGKTLWFIQVCGIVFCDT
jgi:succinate-acetate transporter protein